MVLDRPRRYELSTQTDTRRDLCLACPHCRGLTDSHVKCDLARTKCGCVRLTSRPTRCRAGRWSA